ncbi:PREDICTED: transcription initiation factor TFIID subunit 4-like, partial [Chinchilla lanigera]|uniref:transcription initiation factor TFIID subunit 4-like n=1 Tax=Chinchilla lanigera TaxID=34839 RepID=UPI0006985A01
LLPLRPPEVGPLGFGVGVPSARSRSLCPPPELQTACRALRGYNLPETRGSLVAWSPGRLGGSRARPLGCPALPAAGSGARRSPQPPATEATATASRGAAGRGAPAGREAPPGVRPEGTCGSRVLADAWAARAPRSAPGGSWGPRRLCPRSRPTRCLAPSVPGPHRRRSPGLGSGVRVGAAAVPCHPPRPPGCPVGPAVPVSRDRRLRPARASTHVLEPRGSFAQARRPGPAEARPCRPGGLEASPGRRPRPALRPADLGTRTANTGKGGRTVSCPAISVPGLSAA